MGTYVVICMSGTKALVRARSAAEAEARWNRDADRGESEYCITGHAHRASRQEIQWCVEGGYDFREE